MMKQELGRGLKRTWSGSDAFWFDFYSETGEIEKAISDFTKAIRINRKLAILYKNRGALYKKTGQLGKAAIDFQKAEKFKKKS